MLERQDVEILRAQVIARAQIDLEFRQRLLADSRGALRELGIEMPSGFKVTVLESTATSHYLVLPPLDGDELSDEDLEAVAGGSCWTFFKRSRRNPDTSGTGGSGGDGGLDGYEQASLEKGDIGSLIRDRDSGEYDVKAYDDQGREQSETIVNRLSTITEEDFDQLSESYSRLSSEQRDEVDANLLVNKDIDSAEEMNDLIGHYAQEKSMDVEDHPSIPQNPRGHELYIDYRKGLGEDERAAFDKRTGEWGSDVFLYLNRIEDPGDRRVIAARLFENDTLTTKDDVRFQFEQLEQIHKRK